MNLLQVREKLKNLNREKIYKYCITNKYKYKYKKVNSFWVNIIDASKEGWILSKFAEEMKKSLELLGVKVTITDKFEKDASINHYVIYYDIHDTVNEKTTFMITHVECMEKIALIKHYISQGATGICMSKEVMDKLVLNGVPRNKICYINPAHDDVIKPKKFIIGITHRVYTNDFRKRDSMIIDVCKNLDHDFFALKIMGSGWEEIVQELKNLNFDVTYFPEFNKETYNELIPSLDFFYYDGWDEGNMGYLDALSAGITSLVTPQGYHLDMGVNTIFCRTVYDFSNELNKYANNRKIICNSVKDANWELYTYKHIEIWTYLLKCESLSEIMKNTGFYTDGIHSMFLESIS